MADTIVVMFAQKAERDRWWHSRERRDWRKAGERLSAANAVQVDLGDAGMGSWLPPKPRTGREASMALPPPPPPPWVVATNVLLGTLTVPLAFLAGARLLRSAGGGLLVATLLATWPQHIRVSASESAHVLLVFWTMATLAATFWENKPRASSILSEISALEQTLETPSRLERELEKLDHLLARARLQPGQSRLLFDLLAASVLARVRQAEQTQDPRCQDHACG